METDSPKTLDVVMTFRVSKSLKQEIDKRFARGEFSKEMLQHLESIIRSPLSK